MADEPCWTVDTRMESYMPATLDETYVDPISLFHKYYFPVIALGVVV